MEDFIELGIEGVEKVVDKHFHRVPDKYLHKDAYNPRNILVPGTEASKGRRRRRRDQSPSEDSQTHLAFDSEGEEESRRPINMVDNDQGHWNNGMNLTYDANGLPVNNSRSPPPTVTYQPYNPANNTTSNSQGGPLYSQEPPQQRPQYTPYAPPPAEATYQSYNPANNTTSNPQGDPLYSQEPPQQRLQYTPYAPPPPRSPPPPTDYNRRPSSARGRRRRRGNYSSSDDSDVSVDSYDRYQERSRRPITRRRSSSYHGPRSSAGNELALAQRDRRGSNDGALDNTREKLHKYKLKEEMEGYFSTSTPALTGSAVGALVGGWASHKAQVARGRDKKGGGTSNAFLTLLGAAAGGLAVDAVVNQWKNEEEG
ncbi:hypothetical protein B0J14DRAFT_306140 [Halenospora varia]|nr:hypothetical protein B0J14DRAFT_306140 [Halenospora varia]